MSSSDEALRSVQEIHNRVDRLLVKLEAAKGIVAAHLPELTEDELATARANDLVPMVHMVTRRRD